MLVVEIEHVGDHLDQNICPKLQIYSHRSLHGEETFPKVVEATQALRCNLFD